MHANVMALALNRISPRLASSSVPSVMPAPSAPMMKPSVSGPPSKTSATYTGMSPILTGAMNSISMAGRM